MKNVLLSALVLLSWPVAALAQDHPFCVNLMKAGELSAPTYTDGCKPQATTYNQQAALLYPCGKKVYFYDASLNDCVLRVQSNVEDGGAVFLEIIKDDCKPAKQTEARIRRSDHR